MGYEVKYRYYERLEDGTYNKEETKELVRKVGDSMEDTPLEELAASIMRQLARRDIFVIDVEIFEFRRTKINFKDTKGGIIIKNHKFNLDGTLSVLPSEVTPEAPPQSQKIHPHQVPQLGVQPHEQQAPRRVIKYVVLDSDLPILHQVKQKGLQFSEGKRYPVFMERASPTQLGEYVYTMTDDKGREIDVSSRYFLPADIRLVENGSTKVREQNEPKPKLLYQDDEAEDMSMPDLRRSASIRRR